jgi:hypothetical protein
MHPPRVIGPLLASGGGLDATLPLWDLFALPYPLVFLHCPCEPHSSELLWLLVWEPCRGPAHVSRSFSRGPRSTR